MRTGEWLFKMTSEHIPFNFTTANHPEGNQGYRSMRPQEITPPFRAGIGHQEVHMALALNNISY
jgi:hypothetical protein